MIQGGIDLFYLFLCSAPQQYRLHLVWAMACTEREKSLVRVCAVSMYMNVPVWVCIRERFVHPWLYTASAEYRSPCSLAKAGLSVAQMHELHSLQSHRTQHCAPQLLQASMVARGANTWMCSSSHVCIVRCYTWHPRLQLFTSLKMNAAISFSCLQQLGNNPDMGAQVHTPLPPPRVAATIYVLNVRFCSAASSVLPIFHLGENGDWIRQNRMRASI